MLTSRTLSSSIIALAVLVLPGSDCIKFNWGQGGGGGGGGQPCSPAGALRCSGLDSVERCDGQVWRFEIGCAPPQTFCATTPAGVGCHPCPAEGATECGAWPYDELLTCVWQEQDAILRWQVKTNCHQQSPTSMCWYEYATADPSVPAWWPLARCFEIEANCPFDRTSQGFSTTCQGDTFVSCPPYPDGGVVVFNWVPGVCPEGTACRVVSGQATCAPIGIGGGDGGV